MMIAWSWGAAPARRAVLVPARLGARSVASLPTLWPRSIEDLPLKRPVVERARTDANSSQAASRTAPSSEGVTVTGPFAGAEISVGAPRADAALRSRAGHALAQHALERPALDRTSTDAPSSRTASITSSLSSSSARRPCSNAPPAPFNAVVSSSSDAAFPSSFNAVFPSSFNAVFPSSFHVRRPSISAPTLSRWRAHTLPAVAFATSSAASAASSAASAAASPPPLDFDDVRLSFATKHTTELLRAYAVFQISAVDAVVRHSKTLLALSYSTVGKRATHALLRQTFFGHFCAGETAEEIQPVVHRLEDAGVGAILDFAAEADVEADAGAGQAGHGSRGHLDAERVYDANLALVLSCVDAAARSRLGGVAACKLTGLTDPALLERFSAVLTAKGVARGDASLPLDALAGALSADEQDGLERLAGRLGRLAGVAEEKRVRLLVDAEQTYLQPAIDYFAALQQRRHNRTFPTVFTTYQCYLVDSAARIRADLERARAGGYYFAAKLVRGAYLVQERERAAALGLPDPIHATLEGTHACYDDAVAAIIAARQPRELMVATHNEQSVRRAVGQMATHGLAPTLASGVFFGQLLGMCDHVSYALARQGYPVFKYVPYGPIEQVVPYLVRRAQENSAVMAGASKERALLRRELRRRLFQ